MKSNRRIVLSAFTILAMTLVFGQNCARMPVNLKGGSDSANMPSLDEQNAVGVSAPFALMTGEQLLKSMNQLAENPETDKNTGGGATGSEFRRREGAFAVGYDLKLTTGPMLLGITSLAGTVCNTAIDRERASGAAVKIFSGVDFSKPSSQMSLDTYKTLVRRMAQKFWGREETTEELNILLDGRADYTRAMNATESATAESTKELVLFTCSAMLSSLDSITF